MKKLLLLLTFALLSNFGIAQTRQAGAVAAANNDFWRSGAGATTPPDGAVDLTEAIRRNGAVGLNADPSTTLHINSAAAGDTGLRFEQTKQSVTQATGIDTVAVGVDTTGKVRVSNAIGSADNRAVNSQPQAYQAGSYNEFKQSSTIGLGAVVPAVGAYVGLQTFRRYGFAADFSGGQVRQEATTDDGRTLYRVSTSATTWGSWVAATAGYRYDSIVSYQGNGTFTTQSIQTNIPANSVIMPSIYIKGYAYGGGETIDLHVSLYTYNSPLNTIASPVWQSKGTRTPLSVRAGFTGGLLTLEIVWSAAGDYYSRYEVSAYNDGNSAHQTSWFTGWTVSSAALTGATTNIVTIPQKAGLSFPNVRNYASVAAANADATLLPGTIYTVTAGGGKALYIK
jgi:hypothetical protein